jgi:hypothetical protein
MTWSVKSEASSTLALKQDSTSILSWDTAGAVTLSSASGQDLTLSGDDVVVSTAASKTLALKQDSTSILSWDTGRRCDYELRERPGSDAERR